MGLFDFFVKKTFLNQDVTTPPAYEPIDKREARCPYCHGVLKKIPGSKTKCPHCGEFMFVRTRPQDSYILVVTKEEADKIEEDWSIANGTHASFVAEKEAFAKEKELLKVKFGGREPSDNDIRWSLLNKEIIENTRNRNWGLYRNTRFNMAEILRKEMKFEEALKIYCEVCYLDINGPSNLGGLFDPESLRDYPPFEPEELGFIAPGVVSLISRTGKKLAFNKVKINQVYLCEGTKLWRLLKLPLSPDSTWPLVDKELSEVFS